MSPDVPTSIEPLELRHQGLVTDLLRSTGSPLSEYSFANLFLFRNRHEYRFMAGEAPAVLGRTYDGERHALPLAPLSSVTIDAMLAVADCLYPLDEAFASTALDFGLTVDWREADADYVYDRARLAVLAGAKARRSQARRFAGLFSPTCEPLDHAVEADALAVLEGWMADTGRRAGETDDEACGEALGRLDDLGLAGVLVRTGEGHPAAFMISSVGASGAEIVHFAKGRRDLPGAYAWMFARFAEQSAAGELNFEQDLGRPGFAQSKQAFAPRMRRQKLRLRRRPA